MSLVYPPLGTVREESCTLEGMTYSRIIASLGLVAVLSACSNSASDEDKARESAAPATSSPGNAASATEAAPAPAPAPAPDDIRATAASVLMPPATSYEDAKAKLEAGVGGIFIPSWADPGLLEEEGRNINALRAELGRDFEVAIDFEGGRVQRFSEILGEYPSAQQMAADNSPEQVEQLAGDIGKRLMDYGINVDFAPVLDVDGDGLEVVGDRAFSTDPASMAPPSPVGWMPPGSRPYSSTSPATAAPRAIPTWRRPLPRRSKSLRTMSSFPSGMPFPQHRMRR